MNYIIVFLFFSLIYFFYLRKTMGEEQSVPRIQRIKKLNKTLDLKNKLEKSQSEKSLDNNNLIYSVNKILPPNIIYKSNSKSNVHENNNINNEKGENKSNENKKENEINENEIKESQIENEEIKVQKNENLTTIDNYKIKYQIGIFKNQSKSKLEELKKLMIQNDNKRINIYDKKIIHLKKYIENKNYCYISPVDGKKIDLNKKLNYYELINDKLKKSTKLFKIQKNNKNTPKKKHNSTDNIFQNSFILNLSRSNSSDIMSISKRFDFNSEYYKERINDFEDKLFKKGINRELKYKN